MMAKKQTQKPERKAVSTASRFDKILKENLVKAMPGVARRILKLEFETLEIRSPDLHHTRERKADFVAILTRKDGVQEILHIEFQVKNDDKMRLRELDYLSVLLRKYPGLEIRQFVLFLGTNRPTMQHELRLANLHFRFDLVWFGDVDLSHFLSATHPEEIILGLLSNFGSRSPQMVVEEMVKQIHDRTGSSLDFQRYLNQMRIFSNLRKLQPIMDIVMERITEFFEKEIDPWFKEGGEKRTIQFVKNMLLAGSLPIEMIASLADVSIEFVLNIKSELDLK